MTAAIDCLAAGEPIIAVTRISAPMIEPLSTIVSARADHLHLQTVGANQISASIG